MRKTICLAAYFLLLSASSLPAEPPSYASQCQVCLKGKSDELFRFIERLEASYVRYRWIESKIRRLYYEDLWQARYEEMNPLDKGRREQGAVRAAELEDVLKQLEKESTRSSNAFASRIMTIRNFKAQSLCHPEMAVKQCFGESYAPVYDLMAQIKDAFEHIFEAEREYRKAVQLTAASRQGLYPQDALEKPAVHKEYYWRFEQERAPKRYADDAQMMDFFTHLRELAKKHVSNSSCCVILEEIINPPVP